MPWRQDGYQATLAFDMGLKVGQLLGVKTTLTKDGQPVTNLDHYLGALGHVVVISEDTGCYLHVPPTSRPTKARSLASTPASKRPGLYCVFLQFNHAGKIHTGDFTINLKA